MTAAVRIWPFAGEVKESELQSSKMELHGGRGGVGDAAPDIRDPGDQQMTIDAHQCCSDYITEQASRMGWAMEQKLEYYVKGLVPDQLSLHNS